jgi:hypothetical protein
MQNSRKFLISNKGGKTEKKPGRYGKSRKNKHLIFSNESVKPNTISRIEGRNALKHR